MAAWARQARAHAVVAKTNIPDDDESKRVVSRLEASLFLEWPAPEDPLFDLDSIYTVHVHVFDNGPREVEGEPDDPEFREIRGGLVDTRTGAEFKFAARRFSKFADGSSVGGPWFCTVL